MRLSRTITSAASALPTQRRSRRGRRVYIYVRVSTAREAMISPELQEQSARAYCKREGLHVVEVIPDLDLSGRDFAKRKIMWMIDQIEAGAADGVVVWQVSRWGRSLEHSLHHIRKLHGVNGWLLSSTENLEDMETPFGNFALTQLLAMAQLQSDQIRAQWLSVHERRRVLGLPTTTGLRFGYDYDENARVFKPVKADLPIELYPLGCHVLNDEAEWLRYAYERRIADVPLSRVTAELQELDIRTRLGHPVTYRMLGTALDSGFGAGLISQEQDPGTGARLDVRRYYPGAHEPVIDEDQWALYVERRSVKRAPWEAKPSHRLRSIARCGRCGRASSRELSNGGTSLVCPSNSLIDREPCPGGGSMREHLVHKHVALWLVEQQGGDLATYYKRNERYRARALSTISEHEKAIAGHRRAEARTVGMMSRETITEEQGRVQLDELRGEIERLSLLVAELRTAQGRVKPPPTPDQLDAARRIVLDERVNEIDAALALRAVIKRIEIHPTSTHGRRTADRIVIVPVWADDDESEDE